MSAGKVLKTWRQWFKAGQKDKLAGREAQYVKQSDYMAGYQSVVLTSKQWNEQARMIG